MAGQEPTQPREDNSAYRTPGLKLSGQIFDRQTIAAFLSYLALSLLIFGRGVFHPSSAFWLRARPQQYIWFMTWWLTPFRIILTLF